MASTALPEGTRAPGGRAHGALLEIDRVSKRYGEVVALAEMSFDVAAGELFGFVGSNGAGKTTTMRIALGVLAADSGQVRWQGAPVTFETRRRIGYLPEERGLYPKVRVAVQGRPGRRGWLDRAVRARRARPRRGAEAWATSSGCSWRRRWCTSPRCFERLCDRVGIVAGGRMVACGTVEELQAGGVTRLVVDAPHAAPGWAERLHDVSVLGREGPRIVLELGPNADDQAVLHAALATGPVREFSRRRPSLAESFRTVVTEEGNA